LDKEVVEIIRETAIEIQERYDIELERLGMDNDHIHLLCGAHPKIAAIWLFELRNSG
jgi:putative transposase